ncbi:MAG TPA: ABC transporter permease [Cyclobacteriaceae bacterium]
MLQNYFKIALRNLFRNKVYSIINILGLSLGIACCLMLVLYVQNEFNYDKHHERLNDLYRIDTQMQSEIIGFDKMGSVSPPIAMTLRDEIPEIESAVRILNPPGLAQSLIKYKDKIFYESDGYIADSTLFDVFTYELIEGNPKKALTDVNTVVISEKLAHKIFGDESALDKNISIAQGGPQVNYKITGVFKETGKSFIYANFFTSIMSEGMGEYIRKDPEAANEWAGQNFVPSYVKLVPGHSEVVVEKKINEVLLKHGAKAMNVLGLHKTLFLEPVKNIYLNSETDQNPRITFIYIILSIALFILLIGCINFMNLSTAKATKRASEMGIRKVMGAFRSSLIRQMLGEALVIVVISVMLSIVLVQITLPLFNELASKSISITSENIVPFSIALIILTIITAFVAGGYPAFYMSSFEPAQVLKGKFNLSSTSGRLRQALVVFQFMIAIVLVSGMLIISKQLSFIQEKDLGFDSSAKIILPLRTENSKNQYEALRDELKRYSAVQEVAGTEYVPGSPIWSDMMFYTDGGNMDNAILNRRNLIDAGYLELLGIKIIAGRSFTTDRKSESDKKVIINRTSAKKFGFEPNQAIGQHIHFDWHGEKHTFEIIGVMEDFNQTSLKDAIVPIMFEIAWKPNIYKFIVASVSPNQFDQTVQSFEKTWKKLVSDTPFEYSFLDENIQRQYDEDRKVSKIITSFTAIAMIICSLGLFGLSSFMAERRFKEIGIRKVMGASVSQIVTMMSKEFIKLVAIAFIIAVPLAWYVMNQWLSGFAYKVQMGIAIFLYAGVSAALIAIITISYESIRAASANPIKSLRTE